MSSNNATGEAAGIAEVPAQANNPVELVADEATNDSSSEVGDSVASSSVSLSDSIRDFRIENGRTYHKYKDGRYIAPNDDKENERLGSPFVTITSSASVPPNVKFEIDDLDEEWNWSQPFDYIHSRFMNGSISNWKTFAKKIFNNLTPGGYVELVELDLWACSDDGTLKSDSAMMRCIKMLEEASDIFGRPYQQIPPLVKVFEDAGFVDVKMAVHKWPTNSWPKDPEYKLLGMWAHDNFDTAFESFTMAPLTRAHGWTKEEVQILLMEVRQDLRNRSIHAYWPVYHIYGRKPSEKEQI
ncbi:Secondary metabolism regulator LAE1 [Colletotrichum sp. SAR 10_86]|nr:Secondary metabolism regulator LAE1 [Colletotrichum sp. SAR 10_65]KAI8222016.1 Secondary metabolism regulator LAE1 [Colletotrichum sp. SAR 10_86]